MNIFEQIISESVNSELAKARKDTDTNPTEGQVHAGNYRKGHVKILGFQITIENPKGSYRKGKDRNGKEWKTLMHNDYGYFVRTLGKDGDAIDVFIGPNLKSEKIFPIDQFINGEFDETKVMLGFDSKEEAKKAYLSNYEKDWKGFKYITEVDLETFKKWLYDGYRQRKPFAKYKTLNESWDDLYDFYEEYTAYNLINEFLSDKRKGIQKKRWNLIPAEQYHNLLKRFMANPSMARIPYDIVNRWFTEIVIPNALSIEYITALAGHSDSFPSDDVAMALDDDSLIDGGFREGSDALEKLGFYDWCSLPDGSDGWSDYGIGPIFNVIKEYSPNLAAEDILILINRVIDIGHCRGDLCSAFIEGGSRACDYISNSLNENTELEDKWNGEGEKMEPLKRLKKVPALLYHCSYAKNRESILKNGIYASVGDEYKDWWNYEGPNGEIPDDNELEYLVFLTIYPYTWANNYNIDEMDIYEIDTEYLDDTCFYQDPDEWMAARGSVCYTGNIPPKAIKLFSTVRQGKVVTESINELSPNLLQRAADKADSLGKYSQRDTFQNAADKEAGAEFNIDGKIKATPKCISFINGKYACTITNEGYYGTKSANYFADVTNEHGRITDNSNYFPQQLKVKDKNMARRIAQWWNKYGIVSIQKLGNWNTFFDYSVNESKKYNSPKDEVAAVSKANRDADIEAHGKPTVFRTTMTKNDKKYTRKMKHKTTISESQLRDIIKESIKEFYKGAKKENAAYENACDCLYYGYGFNFWFERNSNLLNGDVELAKKIWNQATEDLANS